jgi:hypothetical protein
LQDEEAFLGFQPFEACSQVLQRGERRSGCWGVFLSGSPCLCAPVPLFLLSLIIFSFLVFNKKAVVRFFLGYLMQCSACAYIPAAGFTGYLGGFFFTVVYSIFVM